MRPWPCAEVRGGFYVPIAMSIMHEQPRRTWPQNEPYLHLTGVDTEGGVVGPLRLWLHEEGDIRLGGTYVVRGLKVVNGQGDGSWIVHSLASLQWRLPSREQL